MEVCAQIPNTSFLTWVWQFRDSGRRTEVGAEQSVDCFFKGG